MITPPVGAPQAPLPIVTAETEAFWRGGREGKLLIARCGACGFYVHPPLPICPQCLNTTITPTPVSGRATLASFTVNHQAWTSDMVVPFVIGVVELIEQPSVRLTTNIVCTPLDRIVIGMQLRVIFSQREDVWLPLFLECLAE
jgi:uncharacterized protein